VAVDQNTPNADITGEPKAFAKPSIELSREELERRLATRTAELAAAHRRIEELADSAKTLKGIRKSLEFRVGHKLVSPFQKLVRVLRGKKSAPCHDEANPKYPRSSYREWWQAHRVTPADLAKMSGEIEKFPAKPLMSIVMPVFNTPLAMLEEAVVSL